MVKIVLDSYVYTKSYLILKSKNVVKFYVHIRPIFSYRVTYSVSSSVCQYADDTLVYRPVNDETDVTALQYDLDTVMKWAQDWHMSFNPRKTEFLRITNKHNYIPSSYYLQNTFDKIPLVDHVKYLRVIIDKNLNWSYVNMISAKANLARGFLQRNCHFQSKFHVILQLCTQSLCMHVLFGHPTIHIT